MNKKSTNTPDANDTNPTSVAGAKPPVEHTHNTSQSPAAEPAIAVETTEAIETMPATDAATGVPVDTVVIVKPPKKKKTGIIIGIIVAVLLVLGGIGFAIWYFAIYQNPEKVVFDSINNLITAENVSPHGMFAGTIPASNGYKVEFIVAAESASRHLPNESSVWLSLNVHDASGDTVLDDPIKLNVGTVQMSDGVAYLKLDHLSDTLDQILPNIFPSTNCAPGATNCAGTNVIEVALYEVAGLIEGEWWQISLSDILDEIGEFEDWQAEAIEKIYTCALDAMNADNSQELSILYSRNRFVEVDELAKSDSRPEGTTGYSVSLNYDALANFLNAARRTSSTTEFYDCYNAAIEKAAQHADSSYDEEDLAEAKISTDDIKDLSASDLKKYLPASAEITLYIDTWSHALREVEIQLDDSESRSASLSVAFEYDVKTVSAPSEYRPITELFEEVVDTLTDLFSLVEDDAPEIPDFKLPLGIGV